MHVPGREDTLGVPYERRTIRGTKKRVGIAVRATYSFRCVIEMMRVMHDGETLNSVAFVSHQSFFICWRAAWTVKRMWENSSRWERQNGLFIATLCAMFFKVISSRTW